MHLAFSLAAVLTIVYRPGQTIFYAEEPSDSFFLILTGEVALESSIR